MLMLPVPKSQSQAAAPCAYAPAHSTMKHHAKVAGRPRADRACGEGTRLPSAVAALASSAAAAASLSGVGVGAAFGGHCTLSAVAAGGAAGFFPLPPLMWNALPSAVIDVGERCAPCRERMCTTCEWP
jgi:hypothetical protein